MLTAMQLQMAQALFDRGNEAVARASSSSLSSSSSSSSSLPLPLFKGSATHIEEGLALYRGNQIAMWDKTLSAAYPVLRQLVGEEFFGGLTKVYGQHHPSTDGDLHRYGAVFAEFLEGFAPVASYPYFPDVARYEWALHRAHFSPAVPIIDRAYLASCSPQQLDNLRVCLHPACTLLKSNWAVSALWRAHQSASSSGAEIVLPQQIDNADFAVTVRPRWRVDLLSLSSASSAALHRIEQGGSIGDAIDHALAIDTEFSLATELAQWIDYAMLCAVND